VKGRCGGECVEGRCGGEVNLAIHLLSDVLPNPLNVADTPSKVPSVGSARLTGWMKPEITDVRLNAKHKRPLVMYRSFTPPKCNFKPSVLELTFRNPVSYIQDRHTATLQIHHLIYTYIFSTNIHTEFFNILHTLRFVLFKMPFIS
jgi:hypothetical protein